MKLSTILTVLVILALVTGGAYYYFSRKKPTPYRTSPTFMYECGRGTISTTCNHPQWYLFGPLTHMTRMVIMLDTQNRTISDLVRKLYDKILMEHQRLVMPYTLIC